MTALFPTLLWLLKKIPWKGLNWTHAQDQLYRVASKGETMLINDL